MLPCWGLGRVGQSQAPCMEGVSGAGPYSRQAIHQGVAFLAEFERELKGVVFECWPLPKSGVLASKDK